MCIRDRFTFDMETANVLKYKTPKELTSEIHKELEASGNKGALWDLAFQTVQEMLEDKKPPHVDSSWLHYELLFMAEPVKYQNTYIYNFLAFKRENDVKFFLNTVTLKRNATDMSKIASCLNGVCYLIREGANYSNAVVQALEWNPFKSNEIDSSD
eukprot:TRINITY_DN8054_c0_g2_i1.p1 TRINITY_DN8054_c0_g2~~TRINITY_DN8054_c0_g2_i1.p1  ORF type:complete len:156 (+),score=37.23 TRINITY_DN8054_c0_g2_i1:66-533(+)